MHCDGNNIFIISSILFIIVNTTATHMYSNKNNMSNQHANHHTPSLSTYQLEVLKHFTCIEETDVETTVATNTNCHLFLCPYCGDEPGYYFSYDGTSVISPHVHFRCYSCPYQWMLCRLCSNDLQPRLLKKRDQCRNIKNVFSNLQTMMTQHTLERHFSQENDSSFDNMEDADFIEFEIDSDVHTTSDIESHSMNSTALMESLRITFPTVSNDQKTIQHNDHICTFLYKKISNNSYREHLILDKWLSLSSDEYSISSDDCDLFLRIVRQIILSSRDEQGELTDIYSRIENRNAMETNHLYNHISQLTQIIDTQQSLINDMCNQFGINSDDCLHPIPTLERNANHESKFKKLKIPSSLKDARLVSEKFLPGMICPQVHKSNKDGYSYVLPSEVLPLAIASGLLFEHIDKDSDYFETVNKRSIFQANYIKEIMDNFIDDAVNTENSNITTLMVPLGLWSDGCDAGSASKANRNLVKLTTLHFVNPHIKEEHVFPIALGEHNADHDYVRKILMDDLYSLSQSMRKCYVPSLQKVVQMKFFIAYYIQDRVEHNEFTGFSNHAGLCSSIPGYSCPIIIDNNTSSSHTILLQKPIPSCELCLVRRVFYYTHGFYNQSFVSKNDCPDCYDWDVEKVKFNAHQDYPSELLEEGSDGTLKCKKITFQSMLKACVIMFENIYLHKWTQQQMLRYAQVECIKRSIVLDIYKHAATIRSRTKKLAQRPVPPLPKNILPSGMNQKLFKLDQCIVGVMHTLILNLGKHMLITAVRSLGSNWTKLYRTSNTLLILVNKLSLSWCKCFNFGNTKTSPGSMWVSENYLAFAFVSKSLFSFLHRIDDNYELLRDVFWCYYTMISHVMQLNVPTNKSCDQVGSIAKIFLSLFNLLDQSLPGDKDSKIETASSMISVLTLEDQMRNKGMQRNYWEGGWFGEGFFRCVKPLIQRGVHTTGVFVSVLKKIYRIRSINEMIQNDYTSVDVSISNYADNEDTDLFDVSRYRRFHCYNKIDEALNSIQEINPLAVFYHIPTKQFYVCIKKKRKKWLVTLSVQNATVEKETLLFELLLDEFDNAKEIGDVSLKSTEYKSVLMLPICNEEETVKYYAISDDHSEYSIDGLWKLPKLHIDSIIADDLNYGTEGILLNDLEIWNNSEAIDELIGEEVVPIANTTCGFVTSSFFIDGIENENNARWEVTYYNGKVSENNKVCSEIYDVEELSIKI